VSKPEKPLDEMTDEEIEAYADDLFDVMKANYDASKGSRSTSPVSGIRRM
jgi:hypothetical protein